MDGIGYKSLKKEKLSVDIGAAGIFNIPNSISIYIGKDLWYQGCIVGSFNTKAVEPTWFVACVRL